MRWGRAVRRREGFCCGGDLRARAVRRRSPLAGRGCIAPPPRLLLASSVRGPPGLLACSLAGVFTARFFP